MTAKLTDGERRRRALSRWIAQSGPTTLESLAARAFMGADREGDEDKMPGA